MFGDGARGSTSRGFPGRQAAVRQPSRNGPPPGRQQTHTTTTTARGAAHLGAPDAVAVVELRALGVEQQALAAVEEVGAGAGGVGALCVLAQAQE